MATTFVNGPEIAYNHEKITDTSSAVGATATLIEPMVTAQGTERFAPSRPATAIMVSVETAAIRYTVDGTTPTVTAGTGLGHLGEVGDVITISGFQNIKNFRAINAVAASGATLRITFFRR